MHHINAQIYTGIREPDRPTPLKQKTNIRPKPTASNRTNFPDRQVMTLRPYLLISISSHAAEQRIDKHQQSTRSNLRSERKHGSGAGKGDELTVREFGSESDTVARNAPQGSDQRPHGRRNQNLPPPKLARSSSSAAAATARLYCKTRRLS